MQQSRKRVFVVVLIVLYVVSLLSLTIAYFTPRWIDDVFVFPEGFVGIYHYGNHWWDLYNSDTGQYLYSQRVDYCSSAGLISGSCRFPYDGLSKSTWRLGLILSLCFYFMLVAMLFVYSNALMILAAWYFKMYKREVYMSFLAISCGVLYPVAGLLIVTSSVFVIATYTSDSGFSVYLCLIAGCLNLVCYAGLRLYDYMYTAARNQKKQADSNKTS